MEQILFLAVHCSYTRANQGITTEDIRRWHVEDNKWSDIGYHLVIERDGSVVDGRPLSRAGAHTKGINDRSIGICMVGGMSADGKTAEDNFTNEQKIALRAVLDDLRVKHDRAVVVGHHHFSSKPCPAFNVVRWYYQ